MPAVGDNFLRYKILSLIGSGGMGEVYLAKDTQLDRNVAVKILKPKLSHRHGDALERFILEARSASALNHPNIITIYEIGEYEGSHYIASEFVEGHTLHDRINRKSLSVPEILTISIQTAAALTAAHAAGIVHRDIKPENIMVRSDGYVKVLDFGLAKLTEIETELADGDADTRRLVATNPGIVMGTVSYMSPEQARGKTVDKRTDIWSLGVVMYEMMTGVRPFTGETTSDVIASILKSEPEPVSKRASGTPHELERIIGKALRKDRDERYQNIKDMLIDLNDLKRELDVQMRSDTASFGITNGENRGIPTGNGNLVVESTGLAGLRTNSISDMFVSQFRLHPIVLTLIAAIVAVGVIVAGWAAVRSWPGRSTPGFESMRFNKVTTTGNLSSGVVAISPDGQYIAFASKENGYESLWVKQATTSGNVQIVAPGNFDFSGVTFSHDGRFIYFTAVDNADQSGVYSIATLGTEIRKIANDAYGPIGLSPDDERFAFVRQNRELYLAKRDGGNPSLLATAGAGQAWWLPTWSPDGKTIALTSYSASDSAVRLLTISVADGTKRALGSDSWPRISGLNWLPDGGGLILTGRDPETQYSQVWISSFPGGKLSRVTNDLNSYIGISVAGDGKTAVTAQETRLANIWMSRSDDLSTARKITSEVGKDDGLSGLRWMPDGRVVYTTRAVASQDICLADPATGANKQLTFNAGSNYDPTVAPDGKSIAFISNRTGNLDLWKMDADGGNASQLTDTPGIESEPSFTPDGRWIVYQVIDDARRPTIWKIPTQGGQSVQLTNVRADDPRVSPNGNEIACRYGEPVPRLAILSVDDGRLLRELESPEVVNSPFYEWTLDGKGLMYIDGKNRSLGLSTLPLDGGPRKEISSAAGQIYAFDLAKDGRIVFARGNESSDAVMISGFR